jgi:hypothetical protein
MKLAFRANRAMLPPWRHPESMLSKWGFKPAGAASAGVALHHHPASAPLPAGMAADGAGDAGKGPAAAAGGGGGGAARTGVPADGRGGRGGAGRARPPPVEPQMRLVGFAST